jgi:tRNA (guanosine-2'-O-)-methyltransferase
MEFVMTRKNPQMNSGERSEERTDKLRSVLVKRQPTLTIILENINDPHNVSACLRSCDAVGVLEVCLVYHGTQLMPKLGKKSSASAKKWVDTRVFDSIEKCYDYVRNSGKKIYTTHMAKDSVSLYSLKLAEPVALVFGNEHEGVSEQAVKLADGNFLVPQVGLIQSLNISVACAVSLYEAYRQRLEAGLYEKSQFGDQEFEEKMNDWLSR